MLIAASEPYKLTSAELASPLNKNTAQKILEVIRSNFIILEECGRYFR